MTQWVPTKSVQGIAHIAYMDEYADSELFGCLREYGEYSYATLPFGREFKIDLRQCLPIASLTCAVRRGNNLYTGAVQSSSQADITMRRWSVLDGSRINSFPIEHGFGTSCLAALGEDRLVSAGAGMDMYGQYNSSVKVWSIEGGPSFTTLQGHISPIRAINVYEGEAASGSGFDGDVPLPELKVWDLQEERCKLELGGGHTSAVSCLARQGAVLMSGSVDRTVCVWDLRSNLFAAQLTGHSTAITSVLADGNECYSVDSSGGLNIWDARTWTVIESHEHTNPLASLAAFQNRLFVGALRGGALENMITVYERARDVDRQNSRCSVS